MLSVDRHDYPYNHDALKTTLKANFPFAVVYLHENVPMFFNKTFLCLPMGACVF